MRWLPSLGRHETKGAIDRRHSAGPYYAFPGVPYEAPLRDMDVDRAVNDGWARDVWVYRAVHARAINASGLDVRVMAGRRKGAQEIENHPISTLLNRQANKYESGQAFRYRLHTLLDLSPTKGVPVEVIERRDGVPSSMHILNPKYTWPVPDPEQFIAHFLMRLPDGKEYELPVYQRGQGGGVLWIKRPHPTDPYSSSSWIQAAGLSVDLDHYARVYNRNFLYNDGRPGGVLLIKAEDGIENETAATLKRRMAGGPNVAGMVSVVEGDALEYVDLSTTPRDAQYVEGRAITKGEILAAAGTPESLWNASGRTFDNADAEYEGFWRNEMVKELEMVGSFWEQLTEGGLLDDSEVVTYNYESIAVLQRDVRADEARAQAEFDRGLITADEYRDRTGKDPLDVAGTRVLWLPAGKAPVGDPKDVTELTAPPPEPGMPGGAPALPPGGAQAALPAGTDQEAPATMGQTIEGEVVSDEFAVLNEAQYKAERPPKGKADQVRRRQAALFERWETEVGRELRALLRRQEAVVLARLGGSKARRHTRHWDYGPEGPRGEVKALDPGYVVERFRWVEEVVAAITSVILGAFGAAARDTEERLGVPPAPEPPVMDAQRAEAVARTVRAIAEGFDERAGKLQQIIAADENAGLPLDEIADHVREAYTAADTWAGTTSREVVGAMNAASLITATQAGAVRKRWLATDDERTRPTHREAEGQTVHIAEPFRVGGHPLRFPHDPAGPVGETINCRCTMIYQQPERDFDAELDADLADLEAREGEWKARVRTPEGAEHYGQSIGSVIRPDAPDELLARNPSFAAGRASALGLPAPKPAKPKRERTASDEFGRRMTPKLWDAKERADEAGGRPIGKLDKQKGAGATLYDGEFPDGAADFVMSTFDRDDWPGGLVTVVDPYGTYINNGGDTLRVVGEIHDAEGAKVGKFERLVNMEEGRLTNEYLKLKPHVQGQGFAEAFYRHTEESVAAQGITEVAIHANLDVGGYAWAKRGFDWDAEERDPDEIAAMLRMRLSAIDWGEASPEQIAAREEMDRRLRVADTWDDVPSPAEMAAWGQEHQWTGHTRHGVEIPMWPGKAMMLDSAWHGVKPVGRGFEKKAEDPADWNRRVMASLPDAEKQFKPGDYYKPHDRETDLNLLLADLLLPPAEVEEKRRGFASRFARVGGFDPDEHPRDQRGRFLDKPGVVLPGGSRGRAIAVDDSGDVTVEREGGGTTVASADSLIDPEKEQPPPPVLPPPPPKPESVPKPGFEPTAPKRVLAAVEAAKARNPATTGVRALGRDAWVEQMQSDDWLATTARNRIRSFEADNANIRKELDQGFADWRVQDLVIQGHSEEEARRLAAERYPIPADEREWSEAEIVRGEGKIARERELIEANARQWSDQFDRQIAADGREAEGTLIHRDLYAADGGPSDAVMADLDAVIKAGRTVEQEARRRLKATHGKRVVALENQSNEQFDRMQEMEGGLRRAAFTEATGIADYSSWTATMHGYIREFSERGDTERANEARLALARNMKLYYDLDLDSIDNPDYQAARKRYRATADELTATRSGETRALAKARRAVLAELRPMGGEAPQLPWKDPDKHMSTLAGIGGQVATWKGAPLIGDDIDEDLRARIDNAMRAAHETYPADWNERLAASDAAPKQTMVVARGFAGTDGTLALSFEKAPWEGAPEELQVATHELGHFMERAVDGLKTMEWAYHWKRTTTKRKGGRTREGKNALTPIYGGDEDEVGSQDRFANHYVGKVYRDGPEAAWELFTTASESLFAGSPYVDGDEETAAWALGVLATL